MLDEIQGMIKKVPPLDWVDGQVCVVSAGGGGAMCVHGLLFVRV
jgi:hypothetical protein